MNHHSKRKEEKREEEGEERGGGRRERRRKMREKRRSRKHRKGNRRPSHFDHFPLQLRDIFLIFASPPLVRSELQPLRSELPLPSRTGQVDVALSRSHLHPPQRDFAGPDELVRVFRQTCPHLDPSPSLGLPASNIRVEKGVQSRRAEQSRAELS
eukprot:726700-Hanusia_phi.AAC.1